MMASLHTGIVIPEGSRGRSGRMRRTDRPVTSAITGKLERLREEIFLVTAALMRIQEGLDFADQV